MNVGGPAVLLSELIRNLPPENFEHILITGTCLENEIDYLDSHPLNSEVIYIHDIKRSILPLKDISSIFKLIKILRQINPDIVHTHTSKAGVLGRIAAKIAVPKAKILHTYHGHVLFGYFPKWKTSLIAYIERFLARLTNRLIAVAVKVQNDLENAGIGNAEKWLVIRPGLEVPPALNARKCREFFGIPEEKTVICWIGRFTGIKNPLLAIKAIEALPSSLREDSVLLMVGSGELFEECHAYAIAKRLPVIFTGWINDISPVLFAGDILLMTSTNEGMPVVIVEAALRGLPTVSTNVGGVSEFIKDGVTGWLINQPETELASVLKLVEDKGLYKKICDSSLKSARENYEIGRMVTDHLALYRSILL